jgi:hypothetical protein
VVRLQPVPGWRAVELDPARGLVRLAPGTELDLGEALAADRAAAAAHRALGRGGALVSLGGVRKWLGYRSWRVIHWLSYVAWPLALLHGLGTGSDVRTTWFLWAQAACVFGAWLGLVFWRLSFGWPSHRWPRLAVAVLSSLAVVALAVWMLNGPLTPGWARAAGTPLTLLQAAHPTPTPTP